MVAPRLLDPVAAAIVVKELHAPMEVIDVAARFDFLPWPQRIRRSACSSPACSPAPPRDRYRCRTRPRRPGSRSRALPDLPSDHEFLVNLNRLRRDELLETVERHPVVTEWEEVLSDAATCARLTPAVVDRVREVVPDMTERGLGVNSVFCVARPRG